MKIFKTFYFMIAALTVMVSTSNAQNGKFSGYMFGDYYYVLANNNPALEKRNGFWFRRIYFTYDYTIDEKFDTRLRMEMANAGDFTGKENLVPFIKDGYLRWKASVQHSLIFGISPTPTWELIEKVWGYRSVEKTPLDLYKFGSSRDFGVAMKGNLDKNKKVNYHFMFANGAGNGTETNAGKKLLLALSLQPSKKFVVEGYVDFEERGDDADRTTLQGFAAYQSDALRLGVHYARQNRQVGANVDDLKLDVASVFAVAKLSPKANAYARLDRLFDPNPDGAKIAYLPFNSTAKAKYLLLGLDFQPAKNVHFMPNAEFIVYDRIEGSTKLDSDLVPRFTFFYQF